MQRLFGMQMQGRQQGWNELQGAGQFQNAAQAQGFGQRMGQSGAELRPAGPGRAQNFGQGMDSSNYNNKLRQQQIAEQQMQRQMPLNELNALLSGTQVGQLQTPDFNASRSAGGADYIGRGQQPVQRQHGRLQRPAVADPGPDVGPGRAGLEHGR